MSAIANNGKTTGGIAGKGFKPGKSGNPSGRPKALFRFGEYIRTFLDSPCLQDAADDGTAKKQLDAIIQRLAQEDIKTLLAYAYGKPRETVDSLTDSLPSVVHVRFANCDPDAVRVRFANDPDQEQPGAGN